MTHRERMLGIALGGTLAGLALVGAVRWAMVDPFVDLQQRIRTEEQRRTRLKNELARLEGIEKQWQALTARTLSLDPKEAQLRFRQKVHELLQRHGLVDDPKAKDTKISPGGITRDRNTRFVEVPLTITTAGTLKEVLGFLCDFYRQDFIARVDKVSLAANQALVAGGARGGARARSNKTGSGVDAGTQTIGPDGPQLTVSITVTALVLPPVGKIDPQPRAEPEELPRGALAHDVDAYSAVVARNLFKPYQPPPPPPPPPPEPVAAASQPAPPPPPPPPVNPRPDADKKYFVGTASVNGELLAYVQDQTQVERPVVRLRVGDAVDDGRVVLIQPLAMVVETQEPSGQRKYYYYPLRQPNPASFAERVELSPQEHPEIWGRLQHSRGG